MDDGDMYQGRDLCGQAMDGEEGKKIDELRFGFLVLRYCGTFKGRFSTNSRSSE